ncbi:MAG TPA: NYN domain-containing protein [Spartobacteria bacterium]|nr:NYN domain-containing protein [Spartobacteria bacterium]
MSVRKRDPESRLRSRVLVLVDESNVGSSVRTAGRGLDWIKLREFLAGPNTGRELIEMVVYAGLPPAIPAWQEERDKKNKFMHWLRSNGFMVVTKDGAPAEEGHYKANVDVMMAIDALELSVEMRPDVVILVTGDADFAYLAIKLRRRGIRVEVASVAQNLGNTLRSAANDVIDLAPLFRTFEMMNTREAGAARVGGKAARSLARAPDERVTKVPDSPAPTSPRPPQQQRRRRPRFRPV